MQMKQDLKKRLKAYDTECSGNLLYVLGGDFRWEDAEYEFFNLDQFIKLMEMDLEFPFKFNIKYSTPSEYYDAVKHC